MEKPRIRSAACVLMRTFIGALAAPGFCSIAPIAFAQGPPLFNAPTAYYSEADALAAGDFNGDGKPDLVVADNGIVGARVKDVRILLGNGNGIFVQGGTYELKGTAIAVAVGDFNGDGILDLAVGHGEPAGVSILLGNGDGTFGQPVDYPITADPRSRVVSVLVGDLNDDGNLDLVANGGFGFVLLGNGDGTFTLGPSVNRHCPAGGGGFQ